MSYTCVICGKTHDELPMCFGADAPWRQLGIAEHQVSHRVALTTDQCVVDEANFFVRGHITLPLQSIDQPFVWSVWCSVREESFNRANSLWHDDNRTGVSFFGWLCTRLPCYEDSTLHLKTNVRFQPPGVVFAIEVQECDHPLWKEQQEGITLDRVWEIAHQLMHS